MGVTCQILIRKPSEGVHKPGKPVTGVVRYAVDEPTKLKNIVLSFVGKGKCSWQESRQTSKGRETTTYIGTEIYSAQYLNIYDKKSDPTFILPIGTYEYSFRFLLPNDIPPSYKDDMCSIRYKVGLKFEKPHLFSIHKKFDAEINVYSYVAASAPEGNAVFGLQKTLFKPFKKRIHVVSLKAGISNTIFSPGQNAELTYVVTNDTDVVIPSVRTELICYTTYIANCGRKKESITTIKECTVETPSVPDNGVANMTNILPTLAHLYSIQYSRIMVKEYIVKVTVRLPMPHLNAFCEMPIVIGERFGMDEVERSVEVIEDEPPSYWEVMNEDKEND